jgi:glucans biosynthesis protein
MTRPFPLVSAHRASRRWVLLCGLLAMLAAAPAMAQGLDWATLSQLAQTRAQAPYRANGDKLPTELTALDYDQMRLIRFRDERATWFTEQLPFHAQFFHPGGTQTDTVRINEITEGGTVQPIPFQTDRFDYRQVVDPSGWGDVGYAGFRLLHPVNQPGTMDEIAAFVGASYFRALGKDQRYGLSARGLAIDTVGAGAEEFPRFTEFWLERPAPGATQVTVYALLESPRSTGAYRFVIRPGQQTVMTVHARVYLRAGSAPVTTLGLAPLTSMFTFGDNQRHATDFRPEVHDSDGLMVVTGEGEWLWRPLQNPRQPVVSSFSMQQLRGFGLMQRDRAFASFEDVEARYDRRPSAWVQPLGDWGPGRVELVQLPTPDETHDNIVAYWVPARTPQPGEALELAYELAWQGDDPTRPPSAWVTQTRKGYGYTKLSPQEQARQPQFVLDFAGPSLAALPAGADVRARVSTDSNGRVLEALAYPNPATRTWRAVIRVERIDPTRPVELRAFLQHQNHTLSETWTHLLLPD